MNLKNGKLSKIVQVIIEHIYNNKREYIIISFIFIIGIFLGVFFINNIEESNKEEITDYLNQFIEKFKSLENIDSIELLKTSIKQNLLVLISIWFLGTTVIGIPIVFGIVLYRGFCLGYTISTCILVMGLGKGLVFIIIVLILPNIIFIPAILGTAVSGVKLYKSIIKNKNRENIKLEILRHTVFSIFMILISMLSSLIEIFFSINILSIVIKYF